MNRAYAIYATFLMTAALTACNQTPAPAASANNSTHDADVQAIRDLEKQWNQDYAAKDVAKSMSQYADDAILMAPGMAAASGKDAIQKIQQSMVGDPAFALKFDSSNVDVASSGDLAYTRGTYTMTMTDAATKKPTNDHGSYVTTYRKQADGSWKAVMDIATSEIPMTPAAPKKKH